jgi:N-acetyl-alpha-D-glucosaminyl L-malate synthase BshA
MKIAVIHDYQPNLGGTTEVVIRMARALTRRGHLCRLITHPESWVSERDKESIELIYAPKFRITFMEYIPHDPVKVGKIVSLYEKGSIDLCHAHYALPYGLTAYLAKQTCGIPYVLTLHGTDVHRLASVRSLKPVMRLCLENADAVTAVCRYLKGRAKAKLGLRNRITVIPNFVDTARFRKLPRSRALRRKFRIPAGSSVVTHISNYAAIKNTLIIPDIARLVVPRHPKTVFLMVGERLGQTGYDLERLKKKVSDFRLDRYFRFVGRRADIPRVLSISEATLLTSLNEGAPLAALESLAMGVPVVSSKVGGIPELIKHRVNGFLVESQNVEKYAEFILQLVQDHELRSKLGRKAEKTIHQKYSEDAVISRYLELYESVQKRSGKRGRGRRTRRA